MEFRIAPVVVAICTLLFITLSNPDVNTWIPLSALADYSKILIPFGLLFFLSIGSFLRHSYYSKIFRISFWSIIGLSLAMLAYYFYAVEQQHL